MGIVYQNKNRGNPSGALLGRILAQKFIEQGFSAVETIAVVNPGIEKLLLKHA
jgi:hypothetical protein